MSFINITKRHVMTTYRDEMDHRALSFALMGKDSENIEIRFADTQYWAVSKSRHSDLGGVHTLLNFSIGFNSESPESLALMEFLDRDYLSYEQENIPNAQFQIFEQNVLLTTFFIKKYNEASLGSNWYFAQLEDAIPPIQDSRRIFATEYAQVFQGEQMVSSMYSVEPAAT